MNRPAAELVDIVPSIAAAIAGVGALWFLDRTARPVPPPRSDAAGAPPDGAPDAGRGLDGQGALAARRPGRHRRPGGDRGRPRQRRAVHRHVPHPAGRHRAAQARRPGARVPRPASRSTYQDITPFRIANDDFYRVDTRLDVPIIDQDEWTLTIDGDVEREVTLTFDGHPGDGPDRAGHHAHLRLQQRRREVRRRRPLARRPAHRPARPGRRRQRGRPDLRHRLRRHDDQHPAGPGHRRSRRDARRSA